jgi:uncharacterized protein YsxB (DUF464 family)
MIKVTISRDANKKVDGFTMSGHADFSEHGKDLVCAGASAVSFGSVNAIEVLTGVVPEIEQGQGGFLRCTFPNDLQQEVQEKVQLLLEAMVVSLETIERDYGKHIKITFKK